MKKVDVLGLDIDGITSGELSALILNGQRLKIAKINSEFAERAIKNPEFKKILSEFDLRITDGVGIQWAAKYLSLPVTKIPILRQIQAVIQMIYSGASLVFTPKFCKTEIPERFPGVDVFMSVLRIAEENKLPVFFFGATQKDLEQAVKKISNYFPNLMIAGKLNGYNYEDKKVVEEINKSEAKVLFVALGSPKQEKWISENFDRLNVTIAIGEGGTLAFLGGTLKRAPKLFQLLGLEWLWRLFFNKSLTNETGKRVKRVWKAVPVFIYETVKWKLTHSTKAQGGSENG